MPTSLIAPLPEWARLAAAWLATYALHSTLLVAAAAAVTYRLRRRRLWLQDALWKGALVGAVLTASLQLGLGLGVTLGDLAPATTPPEPLAAAAARAPAGAAPPLPRRALPVAAGAAAPPAATLGELGPAAIEPEAPAPRTAAGTATVLGLVALLAVAVAPLVRSWVHLRRLLAGRVPVADAAVRATFERLRTRVGPHRRVRLSVSARVTVPFAFGVLRPEVCLPRRALRELDGAALEALLAHELAHLERRDPLWLLVGRGVESVLFFQPLTRIARRRLRDIAEVLCDDRAVASTGRRAPLARCLTEVAGWAVTTRMPAVAAGVVDGDGSLSARVGRLLRAAPERADGSAPPWLPVASVVAIVLFGLVAPTVAAIDERPAETPPSPPAPPATAVLAPESKAVAPESDAVAPESDAVAPESDAAPTPPAPPAPAAAPLPAPSSAPAPVPRAAGSPPSSPAPAAAPAPPAAPSPPEPLDRELAELTARLTGLAAELAAVDRGAMAELERELEELAAAMTPAPEEMREIERAAGRLEAEWDSLTPAQRERREQELAELARAAVPRAEDARRLGELSRRIAETAVPDPEALARLSAELSRLGPELELALGEVAGVDVDLDAIRSQVAEAIAGHHAELAARQAELAAEPQEGAELAAEHAALQSEVRRLREELERTRRELDRRRREADRRREEAERRRREAERSERD